MYKVQDYNKSAQLYTYVIVYVRIEIWLNAENIRMTVSLGP